MGKFMWTAASGISENRPFLAPAANLLVFCKIDCKSVFKVLSLSNEMHDEMILDWWTPNERIKVDDATQMITEVYLDVQTAVRGNFWT